MLIKLAKNRFFRLTLPLFLIIALILVYQKYKYSQNQFCKNCNVILISVDTLRADHMGVYGYLKNTTPNIDKWAKNAILFTNMRTMVPTTYPSFTMLMTSKTPFESGVFSNSTGYDGPAPGLIPINSNINTLAQILKANGYLTAAFINTSALDAELTKLNKGFDLYNDYPEFPLNGPSRENKSFTNIDAAVKWLDENSGKKIFLWIHLMEPHAPYFPIKEFYCTFGSKFCNLIKNQKDLQKLEAERKQLKGCQIKGVPSNKVELFKALYDGSIASADKFVGQILNKIEKTNLDKKSVVMFYGDHGEGFDHNYYFFHNHNLYDSFVKIPFIIKLPSLNNFRRENTMLQNIQIMPTLLNLLDIDYNTSEISSLPFTGLLRNKNSSYKGTHYQYYINDGLSKYAVQDERYKYIFSLKGEACLYNNWEEELYDLIKDPNETNNLIYQKPKIVEDLRKNILTYLKQYSLPTHLNTQKATKPIDKDTLDNLKNLGY